MAAGLEKVGIKKRVFDEQPIVQCKQVRCASRLRNAITLSILESKDNTYFVGIYGTEKRCGIWRSTMSATVPIELSYPQ